jgi:hypothetical protein
MVVNSDLSDTKIGNLHKASIVKSATNKPEVVADTHDFSLATVFQKLLIYSAFRINGWSIFPCTLSQALDNQTLARNALGAPLQSLRREPTVRN